MTQTATPTADTVRRLVRSLLPDGGGARITPAGGNGGHPTWFVGARHVLRLAP
ncbi:aminoglycoside phosphotransferase family protein, partial [Streptomyces sp. 8P21H-1]|nr:aminoglycoside phosphotransferase family protein [Streptomyces sp. 8P21H-1]